MCRSYTSLITEALGVSAPNLSSFNFFTRFNYVFIWKVEWWVRGWEKSGFIPWLIPQMVEKSEACINPKPGVGTLAWSSMCVGQTHAFGPPCTVFLGTLAQLNRESNNLEQNQHSYMECHCPKWQLNLVCHKAGSVSFPSFCLL